MAQSWRFAAPADGVLGPLSNVAIEGPLGVEQAARRFSIAFPSHSL